MGLPNFLIVGAAKSGTTSLYHYLKQHPEVFFPSIKEPDYFASINWSLPLRNVYGENPNLEVLQNWQDYKKLYKGVNAKAIGEASPSTLFFHETSIKEIKRRLIDPKIIILLRNPVDRAFSHYRFFIRENVEDLLFEQALNLEQQRIEENYHYGYYYKSLGYYSEQVKAFVDAFTKVKVILFEELKTDPNNVIAEIYEFLDLDDSFCPDLNIKYNVSGVPKSQLLHQFFRKKNKFRDYLRPLSDLLFSDSQKAKILEKINKKNLGEGPTLDKGTRTELAKEYENDIRKLEKIINSKLDHWLFE